MATYQYRGARRGSGAFLLVILLALAIILYLMFGNGGGSGGSYMKQVSNARVNAKQTVQQINTQQLSILIGQYRQEHGKLPVTAADMEAESSFKDPWGGPITFTFETAKGGAGSTRVHYHSNGPDGEPKTEDDQDRTDTLPL
jgi:hypothetical protein